ncbi:MAG TPA: thiolase family protein [Acidimicrobiales bacterium]
MTGVTIAGAGIHPFGRHRGLTATQMGAMAVDSALREAGTRTFDAAFCGTAYGGVAAGHRVLGMLGLTGGPIIDVEAGCASGAAALSLAATAIRSGEHRTVLCFGIEKMPQGVIRSSFFAPWQEQAGLTPAPAYFALRAQRLMLDSNLTKDHLARVVVKNRGNGVSNDIAMFRQPVTADEVLASRMICEPLHLFMLCSPNEGAAATVLAAGDGGVQLAACVVRSHRPGHVLNEGSPLAGHVDLDPVPPSTLAATVAYEEAGIGPDDLDAVECQDTDAARELLAYEELGLCEPGGCGDLLDSGATARGGRIPVNPSGGLLSKGEPLGASALGQVVELTRQLQGRCGERQVAGARVGLAHTIGRGANASATILSR